MTDPKNKTEPTSNYDEELQYKVSLISLTVFHLGKAKYYSQKSKCAECGSDKGIEFDFPNTEDEMEQIASGIVIGRCAHCGESTAIGLHYSPDDVEFENPEVFRVSRSTIKNPQHIDIAV